MTVKMGSASLALSLLIFCVIFIHVESQTCEEGWHYYGGSCYSFGEILVNWADALAVCKGFNGKLAEIESSGENEFLKSLARGKSAAFAFLGGTNMFENGFWVWTSSGTHMYPFTDWAPGEPSAAPEYGCLGFWGAQNYEWGNFPCTGATNFICEAAPTGTVVG